MVADIDINAYPAWQVFFLNVFIKKTYQKYNIFWPTQLHKRNCKEGGYHMTKYTDLNSIYIIGHFKC